MSFGAYYFGQLRDFANNTFYAQETRNQVADFNAPLFVESNSNTEDRKKQKKGNNIKDFGERITMGTLISALNYANSVNKEARGYDNSGQDLIDVTLKISGSKTNSVGGTYKLSQLYDKNTGYPTEKLKQIIINYNIKIEEDTAKTNNDGKTRTKEVKRRPDITITDVKYDGYQGRISAITYNIKDILELSPDPNYN